MSNRGRGVRGPNSALTEFLRERGINANQIRLRAEQRSAEAAATAAAATAETETATATATAATTAATTTTTTTTRRTRRSATTQEVQTVVAESSTAAASRARATKNKKRKKPDDSDDELADANWVNPYKKSAPVPGQIAFCAECSSRFTVTTYSKSAPGGDGLLCTACGKKLAAGEKEGKKKRAPAKRAKREVAKAALEGIAPGAKSLKEYCIEMVARCIDDVEALGEIGEKDMDRICQIISRNRSLNPGTLRLFTDRQPTSLELYDCARLDTPSMTSLAAFCPELENLSLHHAGKATSETLAYYAEKLPRLTSFHIRGAFLISREAYVDFLRTAGPRLTSLTIASTARTSPAVFSAIAENCSNLKHLGLSDLQRLDDESLAPLTAFTALESFDISYAGGEISDDTVVALLNSFGSSLKTLKLAELETLSTPAAQAIHACCANLRELDLNSLPLTAEDLLSIFGNWPKNRGLRELKVSRTGLNDEALLAIAEHSGETLEVLEINSASGVTKDALLQALDKMKRLRRLDVGFVRAVDDEVVAKMEAIGVVRGEIWGCSRVTECRIVGEAGKVGEGEKGWGMEGREGGLRLVGREVDVVA